MKYWERRGSAIYEEPEDDTPGATKLIVELHPCPVEKVQTVVDAHNEALE